ncbi:MAG: pyrroline-5-carboxylate reductase [Actinobacteria bacterium]|nr:pyrroline-5-carboxylate reductase [Actinomycetota bacterium]MCL6104502.1 pyrroline-5-carboxylate reductase [Actinomycetota bacterium]
MADNFILTILGGGQMGSCLLAGLLDSKWTDIKNLAVVEVNPDIRKKLLDANPTLYVSDAMPNTHGVVLAVKPADAALACKLAAKGSPSRVLSIMAGMPTSRLEGWLYETLATVPVIRAMPNAAAMVGESITAISGGSGVHKEDLDWAEEILLAVGKVIRVPEHLLDAVTGLSGSGPAFVSIVAEALREGGIAAGLSRDTATLLVAQTLRGTVELMEREGSTPEEIRKRVTSPGGTTAAGLRVLESKAVRSAFIEAVLSATERSRQLSRGV